MSEATDLIDRYIGNMSGRELVSTAEVTDLLLDVRNSVRMDEALLDPYRLERHLEPAQPTP